MYNVYEQLQANLVLMDVKQSAPVKLNDNIKYLLTIIDVLFKYAWVVPLKDQTGKSTTKASQSKLENIKPKLLQVDKEAEFYNKYFQEMLANYNIKMFRTNSGKKAHIVEMFNKDFKNEKGQTF